jgi:2-methylisocitrate lyase-like PEP mutase family enzyme
MREQPNSLNSGLPPADRLLRRIPAAQRRIALRNRISEPAPLVVPGVTDALGARMVQRTGFEACYATGAGAANVALGLPDIGLLSMNEVVTSAQRLVDSCDLPVIVDADTGYGGPLSVVRTVQLLENAGAAAVQIEDQTMPKSCGHFDKHSLISIPEMQAKVNAAVAARNDPNLLIIARTDAAGSEGIHEAINRANSYVEAGADLIFIDAPQAIAHWQLIGERVKGIPLIANMVEGGRSPELSVRQLHEFGFSVIIYANFLMRAMAHAGMLALEHLRTQHETISYATRMLSWEDRQSLVSLTEYQELENYFVDRWAPK